MKRYLSQVSIAIALCFILQNCVKDTLQTTYTYFLPVYKSKAEVWQGIKSAPPQPLKRTGKLFLYGRYLFINEINKGVHIIDNTNPRSPKNISFISIPGNIDMAVKNNTLYADIFTDMVTIDITNPGNVVLKKVNSKVFPERDYNNGFTPDSTKYIIDWTEHKTLDKSEFEINQSRGQSLVWFSLNSAQNSTGAGKVVGVSGSMARFTIVNNYLYTVGRFNLTAFNISSSTDPVQENVRSLGWNIETIYPLNDKLFIGAQTGMFIYSLADPGNPSFLGSFSHACFNDPVIADDRYAYVTLRATTDASPCWGMPAAQSNELDIVDISNILRPTLVKIYDMAEPKGLSKDGNNLFICDGKAGLKIYNAANVLDIREIKVIDNISPFDVICQDGLAIVVADEGIYQYDYTSIHNIRLVSKIVIDKR